MLEAWPSRTGDLDDGVARVYRAWYAADIGVINPAIQGLNEDESVEFTTPTGHFSKAAKCRHLTIHGAPPPGGGGPASEEQLRRLLPPAASEGLDEDPTTVRALMERLRQLEDDRRADKAIIASLQRAQEADADDDFSGSYEVCDEVVAAVPASWLELSALSKKDRRKYLRSFSGIYPEKCWPAKLVLHDSTKAHSEIKKAKSISLEQFSKECSGFIDRTSSATKFAGSVWSRLLEFRSDIQDQLEEDESVTWRGEDILDAVGIIIDTAEANFLFGLDSAKHIQLAVSKKVDTALGIDHLRVDDTKKPLDDFISADTYKLVEKAAKTKQDLSWAKKGIFPGSQIGHFSRRPFPQSSGNGGNDTGRNRNGRGRGRGGRGRGRGGGRGKGTGRQSQGGGRGHASDPSSSTTP